MRTSTASSLRPKGQGTGTAKGDDDAMTETAHTSRERDYFEELRDKTFEKARADGMEIIIPTDRQLSLDIDRPWPNVLPVRIELLHEILQIIHDGGSAISISLVYRFCEEFPVLRAEAWRSAGGNCHVLLTLHRDLDPTTRIALQSMLGSDPMRELLNLRRVLCGADDPIALFRPAASAPTPSL